MDDTWRTLNWTPWIVYCTIISIVGMCFVCFIGSILCTCLRKFFGRSNRCNTDIEKADVTEKKKVHNEQNPKDLCVSKLITSANTTEVPEIQESESKLLILLCQELQLISRATLETD